MPLGGRYTVASTDSVTTRPSIPGVGGKHAKLKPLSNAQASACSKLADVRPDLIGGYLFSMLDAQFDFNRPSRGRGFEALEDLVATNEASCLYGAPPHGNITGNQDVAALADG